MRFPGRLGSGATMSCVSPPNRWKRFSPDLNPATTMSGSGGQGHETHALGHTNPHVLPGSRVIVPDARVLDVDEQHCLVAVIPKDPFADDAAAGDRDARRFLVHDRVRHGQKPSSADRTACEPLRALPATWLNAS